MSKVKMQAALAEAGLVSWTAAKWYPPGDIDSMYVCKDPLGEWVAAKVGDHWQAEYGPNGCAGMDWVGEGDTIQEAMRHAALQATDGIQRMANALEKSAERLKDYLGTAA